MNKPSVVRRALAAWWYAWGASLVYWGTRLLSQDVHRAAVGSLGRAINANPAYARAYLRRGALRARELGEYGQGIDDISAALALQPDLAQAYLERGLLQRFHGDLHAALADLRQFLVLAGTSSWRGEAERQIQLIEATLAEEGSQ